MNTVHFGTTRALGEQDLTVSTTAVGFTATNYTVADGSNLPGNVSANKAFVTVEDNPIRWSIKGTPLAGSAGHEYAAGTNFWIIGTQNIINFLAIRTGGTDGVLHVTFFQ